MSVTNDVNTLKMVTNNSQRWFSTDLVKVQLQAKSGFLPTRTLECQNSEEMRK